MDRAGAGEQLPGAVQRLHANHEVRAKIVELVLDKRAEQARAVCLRLLTARARTRAELAGQLAKRGYPDDVSTEVIERLSEVGLVDDEDSDWDTSSGEAGHLLVEAGLQVQKLEVGEGPGGVAPQYSELRGDFH